MQERLVKLSAVLRMMREDAEIMRYSFAGQKGWELCADYLEDTARIYEQEINWDEV